MKRNKIFWIILIFFFNCAEFAELLEIEQADQQLNFVSNRPTSSEVFYGVNEEYPPYHRLALGMKSSEVKSLYGEPFDVQIAGKPEFKNEKWIYHEALQETIPYRTIYFENGLVSMWE